MDDWWCEAFPLAPYGRKPPGPTQMLYLVAYDISDPRRLARVASLCEDYGVRVQYSLFECHLEPRQMDYFWDKLCGEIDETEDRVMAYPMDSRCARETRTAGTMVCPDKVVCYLV